MSMSTMVVNDVMSVPVSGSAAAVNAGLIQSDEDSTITPFRTVLNQATSAKKAQKSSSVATQKAESVKATSEKTSSSGTTKLENIFKRASEKYGVSYDFLVAIAKIESDFNPKCATSSKYGTAKGIMQLMPDEVKNMGVSDPYDAEQNIMAATRLLAAHLKKFDGDYTLAAAAYNAGSGRVQQYGGVPPFEETQNYVKKLKKYMKEGVKVPDKDIKVSHDYSSYEGREVEHTGAQDVSSSAKKSASGSTDKVEGFDEGVMATDEDWDKVRITVGTGSEAVTMTYGAYMKYKELGSLGVG